MMKPLSLSLFTGLLLLMLAPKMAFAQSYQYNLYGVPLTCTTAYGQPVAIYNDDNAASAGGGYATQHPQYGPIILLSPSVLSNIPPLSAFMIFYHECAHLALPMGVGLGSPAQEANADCFAIQAMRDHGLVQSWPQFQQAVAYAGSLPHPGGGPFNQRIANLQYCLLN